MSVLVAVYGEEKCAMHSSPVPIKKVCGELFDAAQRACGMKKTDIDMCYMRQHEDQYLGLINGCLKRGQSEQKNWACVFGKVSFLRLEVMESSFLIFPG